jgi:hypothetical protein
VIDLLIKHYAMKTYGGVESQLHHYLPLHYMEVSGQIHDPAALLRGKSGRYLLDRRLDGPKAGLEAVK